MMTMQIKKMIFEQHPIKWRTAYILAGNSLQTDLLMEIIRCMANKKSFADMEENHHRRKGNKKDRRENKKNKGNKRAKFGNGNKANNRGSENLWVSFKNVPGSKDCPKHGKGHTTGSCYNNPYKKRGGNNCSQGGQYN
eukprot:10983430-Ditylum_brightwellii.AAC.1